MPAAYCRECGVNGLARDELTCPRCGARGPFFARPEVRGPGGPGVVGCGGCGFVLVPILASLYLGWDLIDWRSSILGLFVFGFLGAVWERFLDIPRRP